MQKDDEIVTFRTYYNIMEAEIIRAKLEANGIPSLISDESLGVLYPVYNQGGGGIKLKVFVKDLEKAGEILSEENPLSDEDINTES
ncbi:DUF2007 domain-containing protein [Mucilaginibacter sp. BT774]|uniref:putative signal transducing protein n=1 Tax=Mucilaginibacter sp. BT774 TaxID=3062276 RepID=UPI00267650F9|nr:DUF2007 domain-containing protein [Mucilaginibacter sp. BT774]MDO3626353.1 DUF2007 domain-containing protein [Mucilaginibacter sp. BT774]